MAKNVTVKRSGNVNLWKVRVNGVDLGFNGSTSTRALPAGPNLLEWYVRGAPGSKYTIEITEPAEALMTYSGTLDGAQKDSGQIQFEVES